MAARAAANQEPKKQRVRGPVRVAIEIAMQIVMIALFAWFLGLILEAVGNYTFWKDIGAVQHSRRIAQEDLDYIAQAPRSLLVGDTREFALGLLRYVALPYEKAGLIATYERSLAPAAPAAPKPTPPVTRKGSIAGLMGSLVGKFAAGGFSAMAQTIFAQIAKWAVVSMHVAQDVVLRMSVAIFALPAFVLACIVGVVDGFVHRDLRRWRSGRETSYIYHRAKGYADWALTGGFGLYLAWPLGGFNPAYMVLIFTVLVAFTLATAAATFKKYL